MRSGKIPGGIVRFVLMLALASAGASARLAAQQLTEADLAAIHAIKEQGFNHSQVMTVLSYLTDVYGPRLTASPNALEAAEYAEKTLTGWGVRQAHLEPWGPFGRSWQNTRFTLLALKPEAYTIIAYPLAWTPGTHGPVTAEAIQVKLDTEADFAQYQGRLRGAFALMGEEPAIEPNFKPDAERYTADQLAAMMLAPPPRAGFAPDRIAEFVARLQFTRKQMQFLLEQGVAAVLWPGSSRSVDGTVFNRGFVSPRADAPPTPPQVVLADEDFGRIARTLAKHIPVTLQLDDENEMSAQDVNSFNIVGELPGSDPALAQQVVMIGAHFDSWHFATGATDNGAGSAVMMEAMRILAQSGVKLRRTVRIGLWTGEEQGLLGSRAYVKQHFGDPETMQLLPEWHDLDCYFNVDNGTGAIRGVYLQGNDMVAPIFRAWMQPFHDLGMQTLTIRDTGGTDHLSFDAVGLPGFQFIQDPLDYETRTHHSNEDFYERAQPWDLQRDAVIVASFAYLAANRDGMLPRKPVPAPQGPSIFDRLLNPAPPGGAQGRPPLRHPR